LLTASGRRLIAVVARWQSAAHDSDYDEIASGCVYPMVIQGEKRE